MPSLRLGRQSVPDCPGVVIVDLAGDVDYLQVPAAETFFDEMLRTEQPRHVLLDLAGLTFVATPFLGSLLFWKEEMSKRGGRLVLFGARPSVAAALRTLRFDRVMAVCPDRQAALATLPPPESV